jgi:protein subunit release factor B
MPTFAVSPEKNRWLQDKMQSLGIREEDLEESFVRSSGKGGQHVNKTSTCVQIRHLPSGLEVKCMAERSQSVNRFLARRELVERIERLAGGETRRDRETEKLKKQKARQKRRSAKKYDNTQTAESGPPPQRHGDTEKS